ncbi:MAG: hypothetical protein RR720_09280 [Comamonas sp.]|uniref:capsular polysaccharide export protein, LipB/KpsS family n=1 Tax=Comamonas sp. TaxID=34028 RepID=UPI002FCC55A5
MTKKYNILVPDDLHINQRNFTSFFKFVEKSGASVKFVKGRRDWISLFGNYEEKSHELNEFARILSHLDQETLFNYSIKGVNLFKISRAEILSKVIVGPSWFNEPLPLKSEEIFHKMLMLNKQVLMQCLAAAWEWLDFWSKFLADEKEFTHCCVFSGSLIYQRSLVELLRYTPTKVLHMESFFTGNDYYCEEKYGPIANNCDIRHQAVFESLSPAMLANDLDRDRMKAINKVVLAKNKNVVQPDFGEDVIFSLPGKVVAVLGQVVNDFSLLEYKNLGISSISFYKEIILGLVRGGFNVVFKSHPWEERKTNIEKSLTKDVLNDYVAGFSPEERERIKIVDHYPIDRLFSMSSFVVGLNSQSLIEAAFHGLKPVQFGNAFFGGKGFTSDYSFTSCKRFLADIDSGCVSGSLNLDEFAAFEEFLRRLMQGQLVSVHDSGVARLNSIFEANPTIGLAKNTSKTVGSRADDSQSLEKSSKNIAIESQNIEEKSIPVKDYPSEVMTLGNAVGDLGKTSSVRRKLRKFMLNPRKFCADSHVVPIRALRHFFPAKS